MNEADKHTTLLKGPGAIAAYHFHNLPHVLRKRLKPGEEDKSYEIQNSLVPYMFAIYGTSEKPLTEQESREIYKTIWNDNPSLAIFLYKYSLVPGDWYRALV